MVFSVKIGGQVMQELLSGLGGGQLLLPSHLLVFFIAYFIWSRRKVTWSFGSVIFDILGLLSSLLSLIMTLLFLIDTPSPAGTGSLGMWYMIYAILTLGLIVVLTHLVFFLCGRFVGRMMQLWRLRKLGRNLGRQGENTSRA